MRKQESLLTSLHAAIAAGRISQSKEEQLWEAQRIVTLLKVSEKLLGGSLCLVGQLVPETGIILVFVEKLFRQMFFCLKASPQSAKILMDCCQLEF